MKVRQQRGFTCARALGATALLALAVTSSAQVRPKQTDRDLHGLAGPVHRVRMFAAVAGGPVEPAETLTFDRDGAMTEREVFVDGRRTGHVTFTVDASGMLRMRSATPDGLGLGFRRTRIRPRESSERAFEPGADGSYVFVAKRTFDSAGRVINEVVFGGEDLTRTPPLARTMFRYGPQGRLSERLRFYGPTNAPLDKEIYGYDPDGRLVEITHYWLSNALPTKKALASEPDGHGNWIRRVETATIGTQKVETVWTRTIEYFPR